MGFGRCLRQAEFGGSGQAQGFAGFGGEAAADNQVDAAAGLNFIKQHLRFQFEFGHGFAVFHDFAFIRQNIDHVAHLQGGHVYFNRQCAGIFLGVEENRSDFAAEAHAAEAFVGHKRNVVAGVPDHRVGGGFARRAGADHIADIGHEVAFGFQFFQQFDGADFAGFIGHNAVARVFQHGQRVQRNIGAAPRIGRGRQIIGVGFAVYLEHGNGDFFGHFFARGKPFGISP